MTRRRIFGTHIATTYWRLVPPLRLRSRCGSTSTQGTLLVGAAALLWGLSGSLVRLLTDRGISPLRIAELRSVAMTIMLVGGLLVLRPKLLAIDLRDLPRIAAFGIVLSIVEASSFVAIQRLQIAVALIIQFTAPVLLLIWLRFGRRRSLAGSLWIAAALSLVGSACVVRAYHPGQLEVVGLIAAVVSAVALALELVGGERAGYRLSPLTLLAWASLCSTVLWLVIQPLWTFPVERLDVERDGATIVALVVLGTVAPALCLLAGLQRIPAVRAAVVASVEPIFGGMFAVLIHAERLALDQILGGAVVLAAVVFIQRRPLSTHEWVRPSARAGDSTGARAGVS